MKIILNLADVKRLNVSPNVYLAIYAIATDQFIQFLKYVSLSDIEIDTLANLQVVEKRGSTMLFNNEHLLTAKKLLKHEDLAWIEDWIDLWPEGIKSGGYYVRSSKNAVISHMKRFMNLYGYTSDVILKATSLYLHEMRSKGWKGIQLAHNFIEKSNNSTLETYCRQLNKMTDHESRFEHEYGINA